MFWEAAFLTLTLVKTTICILGFNLGVVNDCLVNMGVSEDGTIEEREWVWGEWFLSQFPCG